MGNRYIELSHLVRHETKKGYQRMRALMRQYGGNLQRIAEGEDISEATLKRLISRLEQDGYPIRTYMAKCKATEVCESR